MGDAWLLFLAVMTFGSGWSMLAALNAPRLALAKKNA